MKVAFFDCMSGASGDMILASLIDAGLDVASLYEDLRTLPMGSFEISTHKVERRGIAALMFNVDIQDPTEEKRTLNDVTGIIQGSGLESSLKKICVEIFQRLAEAEGKVHGIDSERVHFHEVGAVDSIVDIVGVVVGLAKLGVEEVYYGPLALGSGSVECAHGTIPVPAPATLELVSGLRVIPTGTDGEMLTPTGAVILTTIGTQSAPPSDFTLELIGHGAGSAEREGRPNILRVMIGESRVPVGDGGVLVMETNVDDMPPEHFPIVFEKALEAGALDVYLTPIQMKKGRPGQLLTMIVDQQHRLRVEEVIFRNTTTFGLRCYMVERSCLERFEEVVDTRFGPVRIKRGFLHGRLLRSSPEYEDCKRVAEDKGVSLKEVYDAVDAVTEQAPSSQA